MLHTHPSARQRQSENPGGPPPTIDPKKLPPGHATFGGKGTGGMYIAHGHPYNLKGELLPADTNWLQQNGYPCDQNVVRILAQHQKLQPEAPKLKNCTTCSAPIPIASKFCLECGTPQAKSIWTPGDVDPEADALSRLISADDPLGSLEIIQDPGEQAVAKTPMEHFYELSKGIGSKVSMEAGIDLNAELSTRQVAGKTNDVASALARGKATAKPRR